MYPLRSRLHIASPLAHRKSPARAARTCFLIAAVLLGAHAPSMAQATRWHQVFDGGDRQIIARSAQQTTDGGFIVAGQADDFDRGYDDMCLVKTDAAGNMTWTRRYGGITHDDAQAVQQTADGGYIAAGKLGGTGHAPNRAYLVKTDANGDSLWTRSYGAGDGDFYFSAVRQTTDGGYAAAGRISDPKMDRYEFFMVKTDAAGAPQWARTYGMGEVDYAHDLRQTTDGGYIIVGRTAVVGGLNAMYAVRTDAAGDTIWTQTYGHDMGPAEAESVQQTADGGFIIAGDLFPAGSEYDVGLVKTDADGNAIWTRHYGGPSLDRGNSVQQTTDGGYIVAGSTYSWTPGRLNSDIYVLKTDHRGDTMWTRTYGKRDQEYGYSIQQISDGGYIVSGVSIPDGAFSGIGCIIRLAPPDDLVVRLTGDTFVRPGVVAELSIVVSNLGDTPRRFDEIALAFTGPDSGAMSAYSGAALTIAAGDSLERSLRVPLSGATRPGPYRVSASVLDDGVLGALSGPLDVLVLAVPFTPEIVEPRCPPETRPRDVRGPRPAIRTGSVDDPASLD